MTCADEFLVGTDPVFNECSTGIATLSRIIVACPQVLAGQARAALVPALYAYWERFFRITFAEFLRCVSTDQIPLPRLSAALARFRLRRQIRDLDASHRAQLLHAIDKKGFVEAQTLVLAILTEFGQLDATFGAQTAFLDPSSWIETDSNVRYEVVAKACENIGVKADTLKGMLSDQNIVLYSRLKELVDMRNDIAHGTTIGPLGQSKWDELQQFVTVLMHALQTVLYESLLTGQHLA